MILHDIPDFQRETEIWLKLLMTKLSKYFYGNGGPIILVQVRKYVPIRLNNNAFCIGTIITRCEYSLNRLNDEYCFISNSLLSDS